MKGNRSLGAIPIKRAEIKILSPIKKHMKLLSLPQAWLSPQTSGLPVKAPALQSGCLMAMKEDK